MPHTEDIADPTTAMNMTLVLMAKAFKLNYLTPTNNNQIISSNPRNRQIAQPGMNLGQDRQIQMVRVNRGKQFRQYVGQNVRNLNGYNVVQNVRNQAVQNAVQNPGVQNVENQNGLIVVSGIANSNTNQIRNGNVVAARAQGNLDEIEEANSNCILMANLQQASTSCTQTDNAPVYDSDGSAEVHEYDNCYNNEIFNMFTQEEQYTELLDPILKPHQIQQNDNNVIFVISSVEQADESLAKHMALELKIKRLLREVVSQDIMSIVLSISVVDTLNLQTELDRTKEKVENCIIKKEKEYVVLWNIWYTKCEECKHDKISYDKAYSDMQQKFKRLQAQFGDLKEFQALNYAKENAHLKTTYKNLFDFINVTQTQTKTITDSLQQKLHDTIYENAKLRAQLFDKVSKQKDITKGVDNTARTKRPQPRSNRKNDKVPSASKRVDLVKGNRTTNLYTINLHEMASASLICFMARATSTKSWLWHQRLSHPNFDTINDLAKNDLVTGLPKLKYHKEHLCPSCEQGKSKKASYPPKPVPNSKQRLHLLHMNLCGLMRVKSINGKRYVLMIVDGYSHYTWVDFLRSKDEAPEEMKIFLKKITVLIQAPVIIVSTKNSTKFKNQVIQEYFNSVGISHQAFSVRTPQQNRVVERRNRTLVEAARTMLIFFHAPLFLWAKAITTPCYTQNCSIIHRRFNKTPYDLINSEKLKISFLHVFGALCYPKNDREDIRKLGAKDDIGFFIGYFANSCAYRVYNRRKKKIMKTMNVTFDELLATAFEQSSSKPGL
uniref:Retrovirus-related Pol polyprotein from transposon TNT 1-94 n=1 Tax=Tanacetum cinerariifolium TaxID=118510 RepID=A0A699I104_TANCI|nr:retrovirus-related Pol polyprotein from transposon TNT 1-94 [Tanacetum cinerariifolium]